MALDGSPFVCQVYHELEQALYFTRDNGLYIMPMKPESSSGWYVYHVFTRDGLDRTFNGMMASSAYKNYCYCALTRVDQMHYTMVFDLDGEVSESCNARFLDTDFSQRDRLSHLFSEAVTEVAEADGLNILRIFVDESNRSTKISYHQHYIFGVQGALACFKASYMIQFKVRVARLIIRKQEYSDLCVQNTKSDKLVLLLDLSKPNKNSNMRTTYSSKSPSSTPMRPLYWYPSDIEPIDGEIVDMNITTLIPRRYASLSPTEVSIRSHKFVIDAPPHMKLECTSDDSAHRLNHLKIPRFLSLYPRPHISVPFLPIFNSKYPNTSVHHHRTVERTRISNGASVATIQATLWSLLSDARQFRRTNETNLILGMSMCGNGSEQMFFKVGDIACIEAIEAIIAYEQRAPMFFYDSLYDRDDGMCGRLVLSVCETHPHDEAVLFELMEETARGAVGNEFALEAICAKRTTSSGVHLQTFFNLYYTSRQRAVLYTRLENAINAKPRQISFALDRKTSTAVLKMYCTTLGPGVDNPEPELRPIIHVEQNCRSKLMHDTRATKRTDGSPWNLPKSNARVYVTPVGPVHESDDLAENIVVAYVEQEFGRGDEVCRRSSGQFTLRGDGQTPCPGENCHKTDNQFFMVMSSADVGVVAMILRCCFQCPVRKVVSVLEQTPGGFVFNTRSPAGCGILPETIQQELDVDLMFQEAMDWQPPVRPEISETFIGEDEFPENIYVKPEDSRCGIFPRHKRARTQEAECTAFTSAPVHHCGTSILTSRKPGGMRMTTLYLERMKVPPCWSPLAPSSSAKQVYDVPTFAPGNVEEFLELRREMTFGPGASRMKDSQMHALHWLYPGAMESKVICKNGHCGIDVQYSTGDGWSARCLQCSVPGETRGGWRLVGRLNAQTSNRLLEPFTEDPSAVRVIYKLPVFAEDFLRNEGVTALDGAYVSIKNCEFYWLLRGKCVCGDTGCAVVVETFFGVAHYRCRRKGMGISDLPIRIVARTALYRTVTDMFLAAGDASIEFDVFCGREIPRYPDFILGDTSTIPIPGMIEQCNSSGEQTLLIVQADKGLGKTKRQMEFIKYATSPDGEFARKYGYSNGYVGLTYRQQLGEAAIKDAREADVKMGSYHDVRDDPDRYVDANCQIQLDSLPFRKVPPGPLVVGVDESESASEHESSSLIQPRLAAVCEARSNLFDRARGVIMMDADASGRSVLQFTRRADGSLRNGRIRVLINTISYRPRRIAVLRDEADLTRAIQGIMTDPAASALGVVQSRKAMEKLYLAADTLLGVSKGDVLCINAHRVDNKRLAAEADSNLGRLTLYNESSGAGWSVLRQFTVLFGIAFPDCGTARAFAQLFQRGRKAELNTMLMVLTRNKPITDNNTNITEIVAAMVRASNPEGTKSAMDARFGLESAIPPSVKAYMDVYARNLVEKNLSAKHYPYIVASILLESGHALTDFAQNPELPFAPKKRTTVEEFIEYKQTIKCAGFELWNDMRDLPPLTANEYIKLHDMKRNNQHVTKVESDQMSIFDNIGRHGDIGMVLGLELKHLYSVMPYAVRVKDFIFMDRNVRNHKTTSVLGIAAQSAYIAIADLCDSIGLEYGPVSAQGSVWIRDGPFQGDCFRSTTTAYGADITKKYRKLLSIAMDTDIQLHTVKSFLSSTARAIKKAFGVEFKLNAKQIDGATYVRLKLTSKGWEILAQVFRITKHMDMRRTVFQTHQRLGQVIASSGFVWGIGVPIAHADLLLDSLTGASADSLNFLGQGTLVSIDKQSEYSINALRDARAGSDGPGKYFTRGVEELEKCFQGDKCRNDAAMATWKKSDDYFDPQYTHVFKTFSDRNNCVHSAPNTRPRANTFIKELEIGKFYVQECFVWSGARGKRIIVARLALSDKTVELPTDMVCKHPFSSVFWNSGFTVLVEATGLAGRGRVMRFATAAESFSQEEIDSWCRTTPPLNPPLESDDVVSAPRAFRRIRENEYEDVHETGVTEDTRNNEEEVFYDDADDIHERGVTEDSISNDDSDEEVFYDDSDDF